MTTTSIPSPAQPRSLSRREAIQRILGAAALLNVIELRAFGETAKTIGGDPNLHAKVIPWDRVLTEAEMKTVTVLADVMIPADEKSPAASAVGVPDFINEWVSAPYPLQSADREIVRSGLAWLDTESRARFQKEFTQLSPEQMAAICDDICLVSKAKPEHKTAATFFARFQTLTAGGFYTTPEGWADIGYVGNVAMPTFPGPPPEVLKHVGLA
jgi:hypothetical protein